MAKTVFVSNGSLPRSRLLGTTSTDGEWLGSRILTLAPVYLIGREPVMRMSTSLLALCCQSGPDAT
jgi:hypothetical protein